MTFDDEITLIGEPITSYDKEGNPIKKKKETTILCHKASITRSEFYNASVSDMKPQFLFIVNDFEYNNEKLIKYNGKTYHVLRTFFNTATLGAKTYKNDYSGYLEIVAGDKIG